MDLFKSNSRYPDHLLTVSKLDIETVINECLNRNARIATRFLFNGEILIWLYNFRDFPFVTDGGIKGGFQLD